jgi:hypothetical protein
MMIAGFDSLAIMQAGGWKSPSVLMLRGECGDKEIARTSMASGLEQCRYGKCLGTWTVPMGSVKQPRSRGRPVPAPTGAGIDANGVALTILFTDFYLCSKSEIF